VHHTNDPTLPRRFFKSWPLWLTALASFSAGSLFTARLTHLQQVKADHNRVFELMIYHTYPGKVPALEPIFRDVSKLQAKYNLNVIGYWVPNEDAAWQNTFIYIIAHSSRQEAEANWKAFHSDPAFLSSREAAKPLIEIVNGSYHVDEIYMRPTDFSALR
jgi:hypothetical protein